MAAGPRRQRRRRRSGRSGSPHLPAGQLVGRRAHRGRGVARINDGTTSDRPARHRTRRRRGGRNRGATVCELRAQRLVDATHRRSPGLRELRSPGPGRDMRSLRAVGTGDNTRLGRGCGVWRLLQQGPVPLGDLRPMRHAGAPGPPARRRHLVVSRMQSSHRHLCRVRTRTTLRRCPHRPFPLRAVLAPQGALLAMQTGRDGRGGVGLRAGLHNLSPQGPRGPSRVRWVRPGSPPRSAAPVRTVLGLCRPPRVQRVLGMRCRGPPLPQRSLLALQPRRRVRHVDGQQQRGPHRPADVVAGHGSTAGGRALAHHRLRCQQHHFTRDQ